MSRPVALVTGPTAGIGREFASQLAERGFDLVLVARHEDRLRATARELLSSYGAASEVVVADLTDRDDIARVEQRLRDPARPVDLLVNNAGYGQKRPFLDNSIEVEVAMLDILVTAVLRLTHAALTGMVERGSGGVINVSSVAGYLPRGTYSAAKAYVIRFSEWADLTYRDRGVRTMALVPGFTRTEFHSRMNVRRGSAPSWLWLDAHRLVREGLADFDRGKRVSIPSRRYKVLSALARWTPSTLQARFQSLGRGEPGWRRTAESVSRPG